MNYQGKTALFIPAVIALLLLTACGGSSGGNMPPPEVSISFSQLRYRIPAGESVELTVNARGTEINWPAAAEVGDNFAVSGNRAVYTPPSPPFPQIERTYEFTVTAKADPSKKSTARITVHLDVAYYGINDSDQIIGEFSDAAGNVTAFLKEGNTYTRIIPTVGGNTYVYGINNYGEILGFHAALDSYFLRSDNGGIQYLNDYQGPYITYYTGINDNNDFAGYVRDSHGYATGFIRKGNQNYWITHPFAVINACNYDHIETCGTFLTGINNYGEAVGYYFDSSGIARSFVYYNGSYFPITPPDGRPNDMNTYVCGINNYGDAVGFFYDYDGYAIGFVLPGDSTEFEIVIYPGAVGNGFGTFVYGINDDYWIVGEYDDGEKFQGFWY